jgi:iron(III) transport system ATP-binding protein
LVGRALLGNETLPGTLSAKLLQWSYLGSFVELSFETELGTVFVVSQEVERDWHVGQMLALSLPGRGISVVSV